MAIVDFKKNAVVLKIIDERRLSVQIEEKILIATISSRVKSGQKEIEVGDNIVVITNPFDLERVRVHKDTWIDLKT
ncbi:hypothetical protein [Flavilitoribacter nigricans]|uniref:Uncharacterized protein n=1 Tax=Flavilitoribacter nigricans (strain ATCC 23147 / DSM 23189 / NBRC 102662 / NCIMB 1420 / SS-2) TaxID=1122177 RepID=A0A2D0NDJ2_FLAN2|nr:hypothetical protein [Flavilitoribacter nigricans]PHN06440.1 hypothetical protein CRP01_12800 [Flavilitoribacter nigricans DSM 23189 = NBRC 102662]